MTHNQPIPVVKNFYMRFLYQVMLYSLTVEQIRDFFSKLPLEIDDRFFSEHEKFLKFWELEGTIPLAYTWLIFRNLEPFLIKNGRSIEDLFVVSAMQNVNLDPSAILWLLSHFLWEILKERDIGTAWQKIHAPALNLFSNDTYIYLESMRKINGKTIARYVYTSNRYFNNKLQVGDFYPHSIIVRFQPFEIGGEPFDQCSSLFEECRAVDIAGVYCQAEIKNDEFYIDGQSFGTTDTLSNQIRRFSLDIRDINPPETRVIVADKDYYCPVRKRNVIKKGVVYDSPILVYETVNTPRKSKRNPISLLTTKMISRSGSEMALIESKHRQILVETCHPIRFVYNPISQTILYNGEFVCKGIQAKLVREIFRLGTREKRTFSRRELLSYPEFVIDKFSTGLSVRLKRAIQLLESLNAGIMIKKVSRGVFMLDTSAKIEIEEQRS